MGSWLVIIILSVLLVVTFGMLLLFHWEIRNMTKQLEEIIENFGTNELVRTTTHNRNLSRLTAKINQLLHLFKQDQQKTVQKETELKQEITNISHDLRTPLTSIKGFSELLTDSSLSEEEKREYLAIVHKKIDHLTLLVDLFYELSVIDSSDKALTLEKQRLDQMVIETMLLFYEDLEKRELRVELEEVEVPPILADGKAVQRMITNIIQNALSYAKSYFSIQLVEDEAYIRLQASNDIDKVDRKELDRIFDRTFRLDPSRTGGRLGLGLHIVKELAEKQNGRATADIQGDEFILEVYFKKWE